MIKKKMGKQKKSMKCNEVCDKFTHMISTKRYQASSYGRAITNIVTENYSVFRQLFLHST